MHALRLLLLQWQCKCSAVGRCQLAGLFGFIQVVGLLCWLQHYCY
jgi:hypothetical protein